MPLTALDEERLTALAFKFNPNQARDRNGRWASGSGLIAEEDVGAFLEGSQIKHAVVHATNDGDELRRNGVDVEKSAPTGLFGQGFYTSATPDHDTQRNYGEDLKVAIKTEKPLVLEMQGAGAGVLEWTRIQSAASANARVSGRPAGVEFRHEIIRSGYDSMIVKQPGYKDWVIGYSNENIRVVVASGQKFNPYHDRLGRFTTAPAGRVSEYDMPAEGEGIILHRGVPASLTPPRWYTAPDGSRIQLPGDKGWDSAKEQIAAAHLDYNGLGIYWGTPEIASFYAGDSAGLVVSVAWSPKAFGPLDINGQFIKPGYKGRVVGVALRSTGKDKRSFDITNLKVPKDLSAEARHLDDIDLGLKFNPYHDKIGRFTTAGTASGMTAVLDDAGKGLSSRVAPDKIDALMSTAADHKVVNLAKVQVGGAGNQNLFGRALSNRTRAEMPQLPKDADGMRDFGSFLKERNITTRYVSLDPRSLRPTQTELNSQSVGALYGIMKKTGKLPGSADVLVTSRDKGTLDGHHRWAAAAAYAVNNKGVRVRTLRVNADMDQLLSLADEYATREKIPSRSITHRRKEMSSFEDSLWGQVDIENGYELFAFKELDIESEEFWAFFRSELRQVVTPMFRTIFDGAVEAAQTMEEHDAVKAKGPKRKPLPRFVIDLEEIGRAADEAIADYVNSWVIRMEDSTKNQLRDAILRSRRDGTGIEGVLPTAERLFGPQRGYTIAVTETTNLYGFGLQAAYGAAGVQEWSWQTVQDAFVDPECTALNGKRFPMNTLFEAAHPRCRCFPRPVLDFPRDDNGRFTRIKELLGFKYSPSQPRDRRGRWSGGRGSFPEVAPGSASEQELYGSLNQVKDLPMSEDPITRRPEGPRIAVLAYQGRAKEMNGYLRGSYTSGLPGEGRTRNPTLAALDDRATSNVNWQKRVHDMDGAFVGSRMPRNVTLHRGVNGGFLEGKKVGDVIHDKAYLSASTSRDVAVNRFGQLRTASQDRSLIQLRVPRGVPAFAADGAEHEIILPRNTNMRINGIRKQRIAGTQFQVYDMEVVGVG